MDGTEFISPPFSETETTPEASREQVDSETEVRTIRRDRIVEPVVRTLVSELEAAIEEEPTENIKITTMAASLPSSSPSPFEYNDRPRLPPFRGEAGRLGAD